MTNNTQKTEPRIRHSDWLSGLLGLVVIGFLSIGFTAVTVENAEARSKYFQLVNKNVVNHLTLTLNKSRTIKIDRKFAEVQVGNPEVADVLPLTNASFYVVGKKTGTTNLSIYNAERQLLGVIDVEVAFDIGSIKSRLKQNIRGANIKVSSLNGKVLLSGSVPNAPAATRAKMIAEQFAPKSVSSTLSVAMSQQVMLEVRFVEATRTASRELGVNLAGSGKNVNFVTGAGLLSTSTPFGTLLGNLLSGGFNADLLIDALEEKGLARRLAEPNLTALSGDTASFLAGGEFPFPVGAKDGEITIEFKKFGVGLAFTPTVLAGGLINLEIEPEVSQLDPTVNLRIGQFEIPSLIVRRAHTTVELRDGQSFAIAGLLQSKHTKAKNQLPWMGNVPVLGTLFSSSSYQKEETDLVIIVTPRLVKPVPPGQRLVTPLESSKPGNDFDFFLNGKMEISKKALKFYEAGTAQSGHILNAKPARQAVRPTRGPKIVKASFSAQAQDFGVDAHVLE